MSDAVPCAVPGFSIRFASAKDVPTLLHFIRELAAYEKLLHEVTATEALLHASLFGSRRTAEAVIGEIDGDPVAFALFFHNFSTFVAKPGIYLEDLYVTPARRGQGLGRALLTFLARLALERGCGRFEWAVLDWNEPAIGFYRKLGALPQDDWTVFRVQGDALNRLATGETERLAAGDAE